VPFISQEMEWIGREAGDQAAADGAPLTLWLHEEEMTRWLFDEGEMKRRNDASVPWLEGWHGYLMQRRPKSGSAVAASNARSETKRGLAGPS
jgi:hypothetical protein